MTCQTQIVIENLKIGYGKTFSLEIPSLARDLQSRAKQKVSDPLVIHNPVALAASAVERSATTETVRSLGHSLILFPK